MFYSLILAGGVGSRIKNSDRPKQYIEVMGMPIFMYSLLVLEKNFNIEKIVMVADTQWRPYIDFWIKKEGITKLIDYALPGASRQESIFNGLIVCKKYLDENDYILIHESARPNLDDDIIENIIKETLKNDGAVGTTPVKDTLYYSDKDGKLLSIPKREYLYLGQNPECFLFSPYYKIHLGKTPEELKNYSGAVQIAIENNMKIGLAVGKDKNFKITTDEDINIFKYHLNKTVYSGREHSKKEQL
ncbi:IspD/TarI family cytidylyltransferase [Anaerostipes caccae]|uniref:IspD/TarI family cytidylyltransferase n=1 Tax=Anaerostipes caccae TaxID=105841 RepID=UPI0013EDF884|nr:IspD/TarI family cytidylyltransferase [Anaerostipes caccae]